MQALAKDNQKYQSIFGQQLERYPELDEVTADVNLKKGMWEAKRDISSVTDSWRECLVMEMPVKEWDVVELESTWRRGICTPCPKHPFPV